MYTCMCVCVYKCTYTHINIHKPTHTLINTDTHTSPVDGYIGYFKIFLRYKLCCNAHPGYIIFLH